MAVSHASVLMVILCLQTDSIAGVSVFMYAYSVGHILVSCVLKEYYFFMICYITKQQ